MLWMIFSSPTHRATAQSVLPMTTQLRSSFSNAYHVSQMKRSVSTEVSLGLALEELRGLLDTGIGLTRVVLTQNMPETRPTLGMGQLSFVSCGTPSKGVLGP